MFGIFDRRSKSLALTVSLFTVVACAPTPVVNPTNQGPQANTQPNPNGVSPNNNAPTGVGPIIPFAIPPLTPELLQSLGDQSEVNQLLPTLTPEQAGEEIKQAESRLASLNVPENVSDAALDSLMNGEMLEPAAHNEIGAAVARLLESRDAQLEAVSLEANDVGSVSIQGVVFASNMSHGGDFEVLQIARSASPSPSASTKLTVRVPSPTPSPSTLPCTSKDVGCTPTPIPSSSPTIRPESPSPSSSTVPCIVKPGEDCKPIPTPIPTNLSIGTKPNNLANHKIQVFNAVGQFMGETTADSNGKYSLSRLNNGRGLTSGQRYTIVATAPESTTGRAFSDTFRTQQKSPSKNKPTKLKVVVDIPAVPKGTPKQPIKLNITPETTAVALIHEAALGKGNLGVDRVPVAAVAEIANEDVKKLTAEIETAIRSEGPPTLSIKQTTSQNPTNQNTFVNTVASGAAKLQRGVVNNPSVKNLDKSVVTSPILINEFRPVDLSSVLAEPRNIKVTGQNQASLSLEWEASPSKETTLTYAVFLNDKEIESKLTKTSFTFKDLTPDTKYKLEVQARTEKARSRKIAFSASTTPVATLPAPENVRVSETKAESLSLQWTASPNKEVVGYALFLNGKAVETKLAKTNYTFAGLTPNTEYTLEVQSVGNAGQSSKVTLKQRTLSSFPAPTNLKVTSQTPDNISVQWDADPTKQVDHYKAYVNGILSNNYINTNAHTFSGLSKNQEYSLEIAAAYKTGEVSDKIGTKITTPVSPSVNNTSSGGSSSNAVGVQTVPTISSLHVTSGSIGSTVIINGAGFDATAANNTVRFGTTEATVTSASRTTLAVTVPAGLSGTHNVTVTTGGTTTTGTFNFIIVPAVSSLSAANGTIGSTLTITGTGFDTTHGNNTVRFGTTTATTTAGSATSLTVTVPAGLSGTQNITVTTGGQTSTGTYNFAVTPAITSLSAANGTIGSTLTITGTGFDTTHGNNTVRFGTTTATTTAGSATSLTVTVPAGLFGTQNVTVQVGTQTNTGTNNFAVTPAITSLNPTAGNVGSSMNINGSGFHTTPGSNTVSFGGTTATVTAATTTQLTVTVPNNVGVRNVTVQVGAQTNAGTNNFAVAPAITGLSATSGTVGSTLTITGTGFDATHGNNTVRFGTTTATTTGGSATSLTVIVPPGISGPQNVTVTTAGQTNTGINNFTVQPSITSASPNSGGSRTLVTLTGNGFTGATAVTFNGVNAISFNVVSNTQITATAPVGVSTGNIVVAHPAGTANVAFTSLVGQVVTLAGSGGTGSNNAQGTAATFNGPTAPVADTAGNIYVFDYNNRVIRRIDTSLNVTTFSGVVSGTNGNTDGAAGTARFSSSFSLVRDSANNIYVADGQNHRIRRVATDGSVTTLAGNGSGYNDATGTLALFNTPIGMGIDGTGNLFIGDNQNARIRRMTTSNVVTTYAGNGTNGAAINNADPLQAQFNGVYGLTVDTAGNVYVADTQNHCIRRIATNGNVTTFAGSCGSSGYANGDLATARFNEPTDIDIDADGNLFVVEGSGRKIRKIGTDNQVSLVAGQAVASPTASFVDGAGTTARFGYVYQIGIDNRGNILIGDFGNQRVRILYQ